MKILILSFVLFTLFYQLHAQSSSRLLNSFSSSALAARSEIKLQNKYNFIPVTQQELFSRGFQRSAIDDKIAPHPLFMPGYYNSVAMMSIVNMYANAGKLNFYCNYYFDADGQLQDGEITIKKSGK